MAIVKNLNASHGGCCALAEICGIYGDAKLIVQAAARYYFETVKCGAFFFTVADSYAPGDTLMKFIEEQGIGKVMKLESFKNHKYGVDGRMITMYVWAIDAVKFTEWWTVNKPQLIQPPTQTDNQYLLLFPRLGNI